MHLVGIFAYWHIPHVMHSVLNRPVFPPQARKANRGHVGCTETGNGAGHSMDHLASLNDGPFRLPPQHLLHTWPRQITP